MTIFVLDVAGCKIKALRAKTNTYIKTPVRGEEPVFVVTGRKEDVAAAKREILSAAEHFSQIRASRRQNGNASTSLANGPPSPSTPGQVTIQVRVPYRVVGLVVGPKGATIKRIQQQTHTYIVTPSRDKEPVFEVTGNPDSVDKARQEIESHIAMRTGGLVDANNANHVPPNPDDAHLNQINDFHTSAIDSGFHDIGNDLLGSIYRPPSSNSAFTSYISSLNNSNNLMSRTADTNIFTFPPLMNGSAKFGGEFTPVSNGFTSNGFGGLYDNDEGIGSPSFDAVPGPLSSSVWSEFVGGSDNRNQFNGLFGSLSCGNNGTRRSSSLSSSTTPRLSPTLTDSSAGSSSANGTEQHNQVRRIRSDPLTGLAPLAHVNHTVSSFSSASSASVTNSSTSSPADSPPDPTASKLHPRRHCYLCTESEIVAALVPCGHNLFCMECANLIVEKAETDRRCPVCQQIPTQAIRIFS